MVNLYQRRVARADMCPRCKVYSENLWHVFVGCSVATELWNGLDLAWINQRKPKEWLDWLTWFFHKCGETQRRLFVCGIWVLWRDRNRNLHEGKSYTWKDIAKYDIENWKASENPIIKINFDALFDSTTYRSVSGIVARSGNGEVEISKSHMHLAVDTAFDVEAIAYYDAVLTGLEMGYTKVVIKGDSKSIITKCMVQSVDKSQVSAHIRNIQREKSKFQIITFRYAPRSANCLAHIIATTSLKEMKMIYLHGEVPGYANRQWLLEHPRESN
ncbi:uncharacterized protein LOC108488145 [Gossypium arboreum]|uniref:uncharacterized protein LOC108488145 n=1 Tax=Gossypium arboreum TaxID=29729 RepID=UPI0008191E57|nr:uncharacterized protein LOC108488145 [Gossypium arboreum]